MAHGLELLKGGRIRAVVVPITGHDLRYVDVIFGEQANQQQAVANVMTVEDYVKRTGMQIELEGR